MCVFASAHGLCDGCVDTFMLGLPGRAAVLRCKSLPCVDSACVVWPLYPFILTLHLSEMSSTDNEEADPDFCSTVCGCVCVCVCVCVCACVYV